MRATPTYIRAAEIALVGAAAILVISSLLPTVTPSDRDGLRISAALFAAWVVLWFHVIPPLPDRQRLPLGSAIVQILATIVLVQTGGITSNYYVYFLLPMFGVALTYDVYAWLAAALVSTGGFVAVWIGATEGSRDVVNDIALTNFMSLIATLFLTFVVTRAVGRMNSDLRSQRNDLAASLALREDYLAMVAHELRNPLVSIRAAARVLAMGKAEGERVGQTATGIANEASTGLELLDSLTDLQSIESGRMRSMLRPTDLSALARAAVDAIKESTGHEVTLLGADASITVLGDDRRLTQVLSNLLRNAVKYSPSDTPIEVTLGISPDRKNAIVVVRDHGPGVPPAERSRLFQKFARLSTASGTRGSGLGLYICREIIRDHSGTLVADWPGGGGSEFSFTVPIAG